MGADTNQRSTANQHVPHDKMGTHRANLATHENWKGLGFMKYKVVTEELSTSSSMQQRGGVLGARSCKCGNGTGPEGQQKKETSNQS
jgi:hypothetical protein